MMETYEKLDKAIERICNSDNRKDYIQFMRKHIEKQNPYMNTMAAWSLEISDWVFDELRMASWIGIYRILQKAPRKRMPTMKMVEEHRNSLLADLDKLKQIEDERKKLADRELEVKKGFRELIGDRTLEDQYTDHFWAGIYMSK